ncbi:hypothetical protein [Pseudomonas aeruginosa]|uniref:hypothetical protein n=1 Tax=Pseudomonas aeruginosa TaxID=287 RepID=UPI00232E286A|nr:hypothetical protein [Pseudomonas aeruginosa]
MSEVKRFDVRSLRSLIQGEQAVMGYEVVLASDYDALAAKLAMAEDAAAKGDAARQQCGGMEMEIEELRAELAALRARVVVVPERRVLPNYSDYPLLYCEITGFNDCLDELARLNGKTVGDALLRRLARPADRYDEVFTLDRHEAAEELRALLSEQA